MSHSGPEIRTSDGTVRVGRNVPPGEIADIDVEDQALTFIRVDHEVRLQFGATEVVIGTAIRLTVDGEENLLQENADLGPLLALYPDVLAKAVVGEDNSLTLTFESGASLLVPPHPQWESWQVNGPGTRLIVCPPGGADLSVWD